MVFFLHGGGGYKTTLYTLTLFSFPVFLIWNKYLADPEEAVTYWARSTFCCLFIFVLLSYIYSTTPNVGLNDVTVVAFSILVFSLSAAYFRSKAKLIAFYRGISVIGIFSFFVGVYVYISHSYDRFSGPFSNLDSINAFYPNAWIDFVIMVYPFALLLFYEKNFVKKKIDRIIGLAAMIFLMTGAILSYSRAGWISLVFSLAIIGGVYLFVQKWDFKWRLFLKSVFGFLTIFLVSLILALNINVVREKRGYDVLSFYGKATFQTVEKKSSFTERVEFFEGSLALFKERPLLGFGPYSFRYAYPRYQKEWLSLSDHPHSLAHKVAAESGLIALVLFFVFIAIFMAVVKYGITKSYRKEWIFLVVSAGAIAGMVLHNSVDLNVQFLSLSLLFWVIVGQFFAFALPKVDNPKYKRGWQWWFLTALILAAFLLSLNEIYFGYFIRKARGIDIEKEPQRLEERISLYEKGLNLFQPRFIYIDLVRDYLKAQKFTEARQMLEIYAPKNPYYAELWYFWAELLRKEGKYEDADKKYLHAIQMDPLNELRYYYGYYLNLIELGDEEKLIEWREKILEMLDIYYYKLYNNEHYTVLTSNPDASINLYLLFGMEERAKEMAELYLIKLKEVNADEDLAYRNGK